MNCLFHLKLKFITMRKLLFIIILFLSVKAIGQNLQIGDKAPEISMMTPDGKMMKLSDLKGKMVLIYFWASWCAPCRRENPNVVSAYHQFKDKSFKNAQGFTVFSVSLDRSIDAWKQAIAADKLVWPYHVSDLKFWQNAAAAKYGVMSIPSSFLIDGNGVIVAKNLRGSLLQNRLHALQN